MRGTLFRDKIGTKHLDFINESNNAEKNKIRQNQRINSFLFLTSAKCFTPYPVYKKYNYMSQIRNYFKFVTYN